jgi:hypothetical protein
VSLFAVGLALAGCDNGTTDTDGPGPGTSGGSLTGTYSGSNFTLVFTSSGWEVQSGGNTVEHGTYTLNGTTLSLTSSGQTVTGTAVVSGNTLTISGFPQGADMLNGTYTKQQSGGGGNGTAVTLNDVTANGSSSQTTTQLTLTFSQTISGLAADDISLSGVSGVTKGSLSGSGPSYTLGVSGFTAGGTLSVAVSKSGYTISGSPKTVTVFYSGSGGGGGGSNTRPNAPTGVTATAQSSTGISVSWSAVSGATSYKVYYGTNASSITSVAETVTTGTSYTHTGRSINTTYYYRVTAINSAGESDPSASVSAKTLNAPSAPINVVAAHADYDSRRNTSRNSIKITWDAVPGAVKYNVYELQGSFWNIVGSTTTGTEWTHTGLQPGTSHSYIVKAVDSGGTEGAASTSGGTAMGRTAQ